MQSNVKTPDRRQIIVSIPSRGRTAYLPALLDKLAATKSDLSRIVVVSNGPVPFSYQSTSSSIYVVDVGDVPTISVNVNFGWYALRTPGCILVKLDNDIDPPDNWEEEILNGWKFMDLGAFLSSNESQETDEINIRGYRARKPHDSESWEIPFLWSAFLWVSPGMADKLQYFDERFVRSDDGDIAERALRIPGTTLAYCYGSRAIHRAGMFQQSTEHYSLLMQMYEATDLLIRALPLREIAQETVWSRCISKFDAEQIVRSNGRLPAEIIQRARGLLREKLEYAFRLVGRQELVDRIFTEI